MAALAWGIANASPAGAHGSGGGSGGGGATVVLVVVAIAVVGAGMLLREHVPRAPVFTTITAGLALAAAALLSGGGESADIRLVVEEPSPGAVVAANTPVPIRVHVDAPVATGASDKDGGHLHVEIDGRLQQMPYATSTEVTLTPGRHEITVEYVDNRHASFDPPVERTVEVTAG